MGGIGGVLVIDDWFMLCDLIWGGDIDEVWFMLLMLYEWWI